MKHLVLLASLLVTWPSMGSTLLEDLVDIASGASSMGLSLRLREMTEAELKVELEKQFAQKSLEIVSAANKRKFELLTEHIAQIQKSKFEKEQLLAEVTSSLLLSESLRMGYQHYLSNRAQDAARAEALLENLGLKRENILTLYDLIDLIRQDLASTDKSEALAWPILTSNLDGILKGMDITREQMVLLSVHLSDQDQLNEIMTSIQSLSTQLSSLKIKLESQIQGLDLSLEIKRKSLEDLE